MHISAGVWFVSTHALISMENPIRDHLASYEHFLILSSAGLSAHAPLCPLAEATVPSWPFAEFSRLAETFNIFVQYEEQVISHASLKILWYAQAVVWVEAGREFAYIWPMPSLNRLWGMSWRLLLSKGNGTIFPSPAGTFPFCPSDGTIHCKIPENPCLDICQELLLPLSIIVQ